jgi:hypothetical protein
LLVIGVAVNPALSVGTRKPRTPSSVRAQMTATWATLASPIQRLAPSMTQSASSPDPSPLDPTRLDPTRLAVVVMPAGSLPPCGSVNAKQPIASPRAMRGSHSCFCRSEPCLAIADIASEPCTETKVRHPESAASSS